VWERGRVVKLAQTNFLSNTLISTLVASFSLELFIMSDGITDGGYIPVT